MEAYMGLEAEPGYQANLYKILKTRNMEAFLTLGTHDIVCRLPSFTDLNEFRKLVQSILFTTEGGRPLVENTTTYIIIDHYSKKTEKKPTAFCFIRSGRMPSRDKFDKMVNDVFDIESVLAVSVVIGFFDLICEVRTDNLLALHSTINQILSTPGVSSRATMVCMVLGN